MLSIDISSGETRMKLDYDYLSPGFLSSFKKKMVNTGSAQV